MLQYYNIATCGWIKGDASRIAPTHLPQTRALSVVQDPLGRVVEVIELPITHGQDEQHDKDPAQDQGEGDKEKYRVHAFALSIDASTRDAPQITMALDAGIRMAATSGLIRPAAAALTATIL